MKGMSERVMEYAQSAHLAADRDDPAAAPLRRALDPELFELAMHATYHANNVPVSDWAGVEDRFFFSCETCGLTLAENLELLTAWRRTIALPVRGVKPEEGPASNRPAA